MPVTAPTARGRAGALNVKAIIHSPPTLLCHKLVEASFDDGATTEAAVVGDWNVEKPVELFLW